MKLFYHAGACSLAPHIVLEESGLPYITESIDLKTKVTASGDDYTKINPKGQVPALLLDDKTVMTEVVALLQYIADQTPEKNLIPHWGTRERYNAIAWLNYVATELHKNCGPLFHPIPSPEYKAFTKERIYARFQYLDELLSQQNYLLGEQFSVVDAYLFNVLLWTKRLGLELGNYPHLSQYVQTISQRPAVVSAMKAEGML